MEEATLVDFNLHRVSREKLVAIHPVEGTFYADHPSIALDVPWVTDAQRKGAARAKPRGSADRRRRRRPAPAKRVLCQPDPRVLAAVKKTWRHDRKPANASGSSRMSTAGRHRDGLPQHQLVLLVGNAPR